MRWVLHQFFSCPYTGGIRQLYLGGKVMELLALKLDQLRSRDFSFPDNTPSLKPADIERVRYAAELRVCNLENPPDMKTLARPAGLSRSRLL
jgi:hypothetical protein